MRKRSRPPGGDITAGRHGGHPRSEEANARTDEERDTLRILKALHEHPEGLTCDEVEVETGMLHQTCSARFSEMKAKSWLIKVGERSTRTGCGADVFRVSRRIPEEAAA